MTAEFVTQHLALAQHRSPLSWLSEFNERGQARFADATVPTRKTEDWKYTSLYSLTSGDFANSAPDTSINIASVPEIAGIDALRLVIVNGQLNTDASDDEALELIVRFCDADSDQQQQIHGLLGSVIGERGHLFNQLNDAAIIDGVFLNVGRNQRLEKPIHICYLTTENTTNAEQGFTAFTRLLVNLDSSSEATSLSIM